MVSSILSTSLIYQENVPALKEKQKKQKYWQDGAMVGIIFYTAIIQSVLCTSISVWFGLATKQGNNRLQGTRRSAEMMTGVDLPSIQDP